MNVATLSNSATVALSKLLRSLRKKLPFVIVQRQNGYGRTPMIIMSRRAKLNFIDPHQPELTWNVNPQEDDKNPTLSSGTSHSHHQFLCQTLGIL